VIVRTWQTGLDEARAAEYDRFAAERSLPMLRAHDGLLGVLLLTPQPERRVVVTVWRDAVAAQALDVSPLYRETVRAIEAAGFLRPPQRIDVVEVQDVPAR
jgi:heme-degrading monooxygenase HmoA